MSSIPSNHTAKIFALVDCNNFFVSCERVFNPALSNKPVAVLSSNDGCIVARSNEVKAMGVPMGAPLFKYKHLLSHHRTTLFSSNFQLYGDMSERVMQSLDHFAPEMEIYSVDEAFLNLDHLKGQDLMAFGLDVKQQVQQWTGIPISIGIAPTKTLAKIANRYAKKENIWGVCDLTDLDNRKKILAETEIEDIWGISHRWGQKFRSLGILTALDLYHTDPRQIRTLFSVVGERIIRELQGISCLGLKDIADKKNIMSSRSFGKTVKDIEILEEALSNHTARACQKLRNQKSKAQGIYVFLKTNKHHTNEEQYKGQITHMFDTPLSDTGAIIHHAKACLQKIYRKDLTYKKTGILLMNLIPESDLQQDFFATNNSDKNNELMACMDHINETLGKDTVFHAAQGTKKKWRARCERRSPRYTSEWKELAKVY